jgi:hypothetical protein
VGCISWRTATKHLRDLRVVTLANGATS